MRKISRPRGDRWWATGALWDGWQTEDEQARPTEDEVLRRIAWQTNVRAIDYETDIVIDILREVYHEGANMALADLRRRTGGNVVWRSDVRRGRIVWEQYRDVIPKVIPGI